MGINCFETYQRKIYLKQHDKYVNCKAWILTPSYLVFDTARNKMNMTLNKNISFLAPGMFCYIENNKYFFSFDEKKKIIISCKNKHGWIWHLIYQKCYHKAFLRLHIISPEICCTLMVLQEGFWPGKKSLFSGTQVPPVSQIDTVQRLRDGKTKCAEKMFMMTRLYASLMNRNLCRVRL